MMRRAVGAGQAGAVEAEGDRQVLQGDFLEDLIEGALQEGRVNIDDRPLPALARPAAKATACDSQMPVSKKRSGKSARTFSSLLPWHIAAVMTVTCADCLASPGKWRR